MLLRPTIIQNVHSAGTADRDEGGERKVEELGWRSANDWPSDNAYFSIDTCELFMASNFKPA
jgi:hypothetical protein